MRSTIDIDEKLIKEAQKLVKVQTKKELINLSLKELIRQKRIERLIKRYGTSPVNLTLKELERMREDG